MNRNNLLLSLIIIAIFSCMGMSARAQEDIDQKKKMDSLAIAIEKDPGNLDLHDAYLKASGFTKWGAKEDPAFVEKYKKWMKAFPKVAAIPYALGHAYSGKESPKAKPYLLKSIEIDPNFDRAYFDLWLDAERWGEFAKGADYIGKASEIKPDDPNYAFYYASSWNDKDFTKYVKLSLDVANRFPESERGAQALYWLAYKSPDQNDKIKYFEMLREKFSPGKFGWSSSGMSGYYNLLLETSPEKAASLANDMIAKAKEDRDKMTWQQNLGAAKGIIQADELINQKKYDAAIDLLDSIKYSRWSSAKKIILKKKAGALAASGNVTQAYDNLKFAYAISPEPGIKKYLSEYGKSLGKDEQQIMDDVWYVRDTMAKVATPFALYNYYTKKTTALSDYKGKVVLLTYWFPGCGPCRGEFPHFQNVVNKFKEKDFDYVGINIVSEQNEYVLPFMKSSGYTFAPLEDVEGRDKGNLDNGGAAPVNFLIDQQGRIVFKNIRTDGSNEDVLEAMIAQTLERGSK